MRKFSTIFITSITFMVAASVVNAATSVTASVSAVGLTYVKGGVSTPKPVVFSLGNGTATKPVGSAYITVGALPNWLLLDKFNATVTAASTATFNFSASPLAANLSGTYPSANVTFTPVWTGGALSPTTVVIAVTLSVTNGSPQVAATVTSSTGSFNFAAGSGIYPTASLTITSLSDPVSFTATATSTNPSTPWITLATKSGLATSFGTTIAITFSQSAFDNAAVGSNLLGSITVVGAYNTVTVPINWAVSAAAPTATSVYPATLPFKIATGTTRVVQVTGTNFVAGMAVRLDGGGTGPALVNDCTNFANATGNALCIETSASLYIKLSAAELSASSLVSDVYTFTLYFGPGAPSTVTETVTITDLPIINAIADGAALNLSVQGVGTPNLSVAPYEILSIFGENLTSDVILPGALTNTTYPTTLSDAHAVAVTLTTDTGCATSPIAANLLFASPTQINFLVPSTIPTGASYVCVTYNSLVTASPAKVTKAIAAPGVFTAGGGTGQAIVVNDLDFTINSGTNVAKAGSTVTFYLSGLGNPSDGSGTLGGTVPTNPIGSTVDTTTCASLATLLTQEKAVDNIGASATLDGVVIDSTLLMSSGAQVWVPPCFSATDVTVTIGGGTPLALTLNYAGWVGGSVAGLYQINATIPATIPVAATNTGVTSQYMITVTANGVSNPTGAYLYAH